MGNEISSRCNTESSLCSASPAALADSTGNQGNIGIGSSIVSGSNGTRADNDVDASSSPFCSNSDRSTEKQVKSSYTTVRVDLSHFCGTECAVKLYLDQQITNSRPLSDEQINEAQNYFIDIKKMPQKRISPDERENIYEKHAHLLIGRLTRKSLDKKYDLSDDMKLRFKRAKLRVLCPAELCWRIFRAFDEKKAPMTISELEGEVGKEVYLMRGSLLPLFKHPGLQKRRRRNQERAIARRPPSQTGNGVHPNPASNALSTNFANQLLGLGSRGGGNPQIRIDNLNFGNQIQNKNTGGFSEKYLQNMKDAVEEVVQPKFEKLDHTVKNTAMKRKDHARLDSTPKTPSAGVSFAADHQTSLDPKPLAEKCDKNQSPEEVYNDFSPLLPTNSHQNITKDGERHFSNPVVSSFEAKLAKAAAVTPELLLAQEIAELGIFCLGKSSSSCVATEDYGKLSGIVDAVKSHFGDNFDNNYFRLVGSSMVLSRKATAEEKLAEPESKIKQIEQGFLDLIIMAVPPGSNINNWTALPSVGLIKLRDEEIGLKKDYPVTLPEIGLYWKELGNCAYLAQREDGHEKVVELSEKLRKKFKFNSSINILTQTNLLFPRNKTQWPLAHLGGSLGLGHFYFESVDVNVENAWASKKIFNKTVKNILEAKEDAGEEIDEEDVKKSLSKLLKERVADVGKVEKEFSRSGDLESIVEAHAEAIVIRVFPKSFLPDKKAETCLDPVGHSPKPEAYIDCRNEPFQVVVVRSEEDRVQFVLPPCEETWQCIACTQKEGDGVYSRLGENCRKCGSANPVTSGKMNGSISVEANLVDSKAFYPTSSGTTATTEDTNKSAPPSGKTYIPDRDFVFLWPAGRSNQLESGIWYHDTPEGLAVFIPQTKDGFACGSCKQSLRRGHGKYCRHHKNDGPLGEDAKQYWSKK